MRACALGAKRRASLGACSRTRGRPVRRSQLPGGRGLCPGFAAGYRFELPALSLVARVAGCQNGFDNAVLHAATRDVDSSLAALHVWDLPWLSLGLGLGAGAAYFDQSFVSVGLAPSRQELSPFVLVTGAATLELGAGFFCGLDVRAETHWLNLQAQSRGARELSAAFAVRGALLLGKRLLRPACARAPQSSAAPPGTSGIFRCTRTNRPSRGRPALQAQDGNLHGDRTRASGASAKAEAQWCILDSALLCCPQRHRTWPQALLLALCGVAWSAAPARAAQDSRHLGVQLRLLAGPSYLHASQNLGHGQFDELRTAFAVEFALGHMVSDNLALGLDLWMAYSGAASRGVLASTNFSAVHVGAGATYWLMPANVYLSGSLGAMRSSVEAAPIRVGTKLELPAEEVSDLGLGVHLAAGKVFWLDPRWTLGASASLLFGAANNPIAGTGSTRYLFGLCAMLTFGFH